MRDASLTPRLSPHLQRCQRGSSSIQLRGPQLWVLHEDGVFRLKGVRGSRGELLALTRSPTSNLLATSFRHAQVDVYAKAVSHQVCQAWPLDAVQLLCEAGVAQIRDSTCRRATARHDEEGAGLEHTRLPVSHTSPLKYSYARSTFFAATTTASETTWDPPEHSTYRF